MNDTTYADNGPTYEATVFESWVIDLIRKFSWKSKMILKELAKAAESTAKQARQESPSVWIVPYVHMIRQWMTTRRNDMHLLQCIVLGMLFWLLLVISVMLTMELMDRIKGD